MRTHTHTHTACDMKQKGNWVKGRDKGEGGERGRRENVQNASHTSGSLLYEIHYHVQWIYANKEKTYTLDGLCTKLSSNMFKDFKECNVACYLGIWGVESEAHI